MVLAVRGIIKAANWVWGALDDLEEAVAAGTDEDDGGSALGTDDCEEEDPEENGQLLNGRAPLREYYSRSQTPKDRRIPGRRRNWGPVIDVVTLPSWDKDVSFSVPSCSCSSSASFSSSSSSSCSTSDDYPSAFFGFRSSALASSRLCVTQSWPFRLKASAIITSVADGGKGKPRGLDKTIKNICGSALRRELAAKGVVRCGEATRSSAPGLPCDALLHTVRTKGKNKWGEKRKKGRKT
eukprot:GHVT01032495.1.p1 GENE.GHVT01032495.1~~GHVT01032495.1.p1  ORF type:complete len:239 (-),score=54.72 GHVT01032495.1:95-811(-)